MEREKKPKLFSKPSRAQAIKMKIKAHHFKLAVIAVLKGSGALLNILMAYTLMNYSSAESAGLFFFIVSAINIASYAFRFGSDNYLIKMFSIRFTEPENYKFISSLYAYNFLLSTVLFFALILFKPEYSQTLCLLTSLCVFLFTLVQINARVLQAEKKVFSSSFSMSTGVPLFFLTGLFAYHIFLSENGHSTSIEVMMFFYAAACLLTAFTSFKKNAFVKFTFNCVRPHYKNSITFFVTGFISILILWGGQFLSGIMLSISDVSTLATIQRVSMAINLLLVAASIYISPIIAQAYHDGDMGKLKNTIYQANTFIAMFGVSAGIFIFAFSSFILDTFKIPDGDKHILLIISTAQIINVLTGNSVQILNMTGHQKCTQKSVVLGGIVFLIGYIYTALNPSLMNIAITTAAALVTQNLSAIKFVKKHLGFYPIGIKL